MLISCGYIKLFSISTFEGRVSYFDMTEKGEQLLGEMGHKIERKRAGGPEHEYWKYRIAEHLKKLGYKVEVESPIGEGKTIDIMLAKDGQRLAIKIETGKSDALENIQNSCGNPSLEY